MKNLRDRHAKLSNDIIRVAEEGDIDLNAIVNEEAEQYEKATRVQGVTDNTNESNSGPVKGHDEQTGKENERENSGSIVYRLTEGERTLLQQAMYWKERTVKEEKIREFRQSRHKRGSQFKKMDSLDSKYFRNEK